MDGHRHTDGPVDHRHVFDDPTAAEFAELEGEVLAGLMTDGISVLTELCGQRGVDVRRLLDLGCGPGIGSCALAESFGSASVVAVDGSATMLEHVTARARRLGLAQQVETRHAELPAGLETVGPADVVWASMVLHHLGDEAGALRRIRGLLRPGGLLAVVEQAGPIRVVSPGTDIGRTGVWERLDSAWTAWLTDMRADLPGAAPSPGLPAALEEAGFELVADEPLELILDSPLDAPTLRFANTTLERTRAQLGPYVDPADLTALDLLIDEGILRSNDTVLRASRRLTVAGVPEPDERIDERAPSRTRRDGEGTHLTGPASPGILQRGFSIDLGYWADAPERSGMRHSTLWAAGAAVAVVVAGGTGIAIAAGGDDDAQEVPITGAALEQASAAALEHTGGGEVTGTEVGDEEGYYEVEVTLDDGRQIDVHLDEGFDVLGDEADDETDDG